MNKPVQLSSQVFRRINDIVKDRTNSIMIVVAALILSLPALFTQTGISIFDFSKYGQVGDTIGGTTAPFVGLISAYLIYKAFIAQINANRIESKNNEFGIALKLIDDLERKLNQQDKPYEYPMGNDEISEIKNTNYYEIIRFWNGMRMYRDTYANRIVLLIKQIKYFRNFVGISRNLSAKDESLLLQKASLTFGSQLIEVFDMLLKTETEDINDKEKQFYAYCRKFRETTLDDFLFHLIDTDDYDD